LLPVIPRGHWRGIQEEVQGEGATCRPVPRAPLGLTPPSWPFEQPAELPAF